MKFKTLIAVPLALLMVFTLATPALAGAPEKETLDPLDADNHPISKGKVSVQVTHDNYVKVTVVLVGANVGTTYTAHIYVSPYGTEDIGTFVIGSNGRGRVSGFTSRNDYIGDRLARVTVRYAGQEKFETDSTWTIPVSFH